MSVACDVVGENTDAQLLEGNLYYLQQQHGITLSDLHHEIERLQQENRDLHDELLATRSLSPTEQNPSIPLEDYLHLKQQVHELEQQLLESEDKNQSLIRAVDASKRMSSSSLLKVPNTFSPNRDEISMPIDTPDGDSPTSPAMSLEQQQQYIQEIVKLRSILLDIVNTERLSVPSTNLIRDCLTSTTVQEMFISKNTTTPIDMLFTKYNQPPRILPSLSTTTAHTLFARHELPLRRMNLSVPQIPTIPSSFIQSYPRVKHRATLPPITQEEHSTVSPDSIGANGLFQSLLIPTCSSQHRQKALKVGETAIARRERRTHQLQKDRFMRNLYH